MPSVESSAAELSDQIDFVAVAGRSTLAASASVADEALPSGVVHWGLDDSVWSAYGVSGQPTTILVIDNVIVGRWYHALSVSDLNSELANFNL